MLKAKSFSLFWFALLSVVFFSLAHGAAAQPAPGALPASDAEAFDLFKTLWNFFVTKNYAAVAGPGLTLFVWLLKRYDLVIFNALKLPKVATSIDTFLDKPFVSFLLPTVASALGGFVTALATGHTFTEAMGAVFAASSSAVTTYVGLKKLAEQNVAGADAVTAVDTGGKPAAIDELKKP